MNIAVFASHSGSDLQAIIDGCKNDKISSPVVYNDISCLLSRSILVHNVA